MERREKSRPKFIELLGPLKGGQATTQNRTGSSARAAKAEKIVRMA